MLFRSPGEGAVGVGEELDPDGGDLRVLDQEGVEDKNMMLIFASLDEQPGSRRPLP